jgi:hypothetical protein
VSLLIPFDPSGLDAKVVSALDDIIAAVQTWSASPFGLARKRMRVTSAVQTITTGTDPFSVTWSAPPNGSDRLYDTGGFLDSGGVFINFTQVGTYLMSANVLIQSSAVGDRYVGIFGTNDLDFVSSTSVTGTGGGNPQGLHTGMQIIRVSSPPVKYRIGVWQNSGGGLSLFNGSYLNVIQVE